MKRNELINKMADKLNYFASEFNKLTEREQEAIKKEGSIYFSILDNELVLASYNGCVLPFSSYEACYNIYLTSFIGFEYWKFWEIVENKSFDSENGKAFINLAINASVERIQDENDYFNEKESFFASQALEILLHLE